MRKFGDPDYPYVNHLLPENPTSEQRIKYGLCKAILRYEKKNDLSFDDIVKMLGISWEKAIDIVYINLNKLSSEELIVYTDKLNIPFKIKVIINKTKLKKTSHEKLSSKESKN
jgi:hypothetical protein